MFFLILIGIILIILIIFFLLSLWIKDLWYLKQDNTIVLSLKQFILFNKMFPDRVLYIKREQDYFCSTYIERGIFYKDNNGKEHQIEFKHSFEYLLFSFFYVKNKNKSEVKKKKDEAKAKFLKEMTSLIREENEKAKSEIDSANSFFKEMNEKLK